MQTLLPPLAVDVTAPRRGEVHIKVCGELDPWTHATLVGELARADLGQASAVRLQLSDLTFCDARGGTLLLRFVQQLRETGCDATIEHPRRTVQKLLTLIMLIAPDCKL